MRFGLVPESGRTAQAWTARQPHITLIIFNAVACVFLLPPIFGTPFIKGIYLFEMDTPRHNSPSTQSFVEVMTFGIFGYCWKLDESMKCSNPAIGYQSGLFPAALSSIARALALHLVSAILVIITVSIIMVGHYKKTFLCKVSKWASKINVLLSLMAAACFSVDIGFYVEAKQYYVAGDHISLGSGIWSTLGGSVLLFLGGWLYDVQSKQFLHLQHCGQVIGEPEQQLPDIESGPDPVGKHADIDVELLVEVLRSILNHRGREHEARSVAAIFGSPSVYEAVSIPGPRLGDQQPVSKLRTEDDDDAKLPTTNRKSQLDWILVEKSGNSVDSLHRLASTLSGYAPRSYHTYLDSESSPTSTQEVQKSFMTNATRFSTEPQTPLSTAFAAPTSHSKHSIVDVGDRPPSSKGVTKLKKPRSSRTTSSVSTLASIIHEFPPIPPFIGRISSLTVPYHPYSTFTLGRALGVRPSANPPSVPAKPKGTVVLEDIRAL